MAITRSTENRVIFTRSSVLVMLAFVFGLLATLVGGKIITSDTLAWQWLLPASLTSYYLSKIIP